MNPSIMVKSEPIRFKPSDLDKLYDKTKFFALKDKYAGQRAFVIGNGPSLKETDIGKMSGELTLACNDFRLLFHKLKPTYWVLEDSPYIAKHQKEINAHDGEKLLSIWSKHERFGSVRVDESQVTYFMSDAAWWYKYGLMLFADRAEDGLLVSAGTVTYSMMQLAWWMGSREIYLVGVDHSLPENYAEYNHFSDDYMLGLREEHKALEARNAKRPFVRMDAGYKAAREFADEQGFNIRNATHGGKLEVFERCVYEDLF